MSSQVVIATLWLTAFTLFGMWLGKRGRITECATRIVSWTGILFLIGIDLGAKFGIVTKEIGEAIFDCLGGVGPFSAFGVILLCAILAATGVNLPQIVSQPLRGGQSGSSGRTSGDSPDATSDDFGPGSADGDGGGSM